MGPSIKDVFDNPFPHLGILTLIYLTFTFLYLATSEFETPVPSPLKHSDVLYGWPPERSNTAPQRILPAAELRLNLKMNVAKKFQIYFFAC